MNRKKIDSFSFKESQGGTITLGGIANGDGWGGSINIGGISSSEWIITLEKSLVVVREDDMGIVVRNGIIFIEKKKKNKRKKK